MVYLWLLCGSLILGFCVGVCVVLLVVGVLIVFVCAAWFSWWVVLVVVCLFRFCGLLGAIAFCISGVFAGWLVLHLELVVS